MPDLSGTRWTIVAVNGDTTLPGEEPLAVEFGVDGRVSGNSGCNNFSAPYVGEESTLRIGAVLTTRRACVDQRRQRQESRVLAILQGEARVRRERHETISLRNEAGSLLLAPRGYD